MTDPGSRHEKFRAVSTEPWETFRLLGHWDLPKRSREEQLADLAEEAQILDLMINYATSHDAKDLPWTMTTFSSENDPGADGVPRRDDIYYHYKILNYLTHNFSRHRYCNFIIRVLDGGEEAWMSGYWLVSRTGWGGQGIGSEVASRFGCYFWSFVKEDGEWKIGDRRQLSELGIESEFLDDDSPPPVPSPTGPTVGIGGDLSAAPTGELGRVDFEALADDPLTAHLWVLHGGPHGSATEELLDRLLDERASRELLARYSYALDSADYEWIGSLFTDDATLISPAGRADGRGRSCGPSRPCAAASPPRATASRISSSVPLQVATRPGSLPTTTSPPSPRTTAGHRPLAATSVASCAAATPGSSPTGGSSPRSPSR